MSLHDAYQSRICSRQSVESSKSNNFGNDNTVMRFSPHTENELKEMLSCIPHEMRPKFDNWFRTVVKEEIELSHKNQATTSMHGACESESRSLELKFSNNIVSPLLTGDHIKAIGGVPLEVTLVDSRTKEVVKSGHEASGRVEILVLEAQIDGVTGKDVKSESVLVQQMEGSKSSRVGNLWLKLIQGTAILPMVSFARNEKWTKKTKLRLGAKFVNDFNGLQVKEAKTGPFLLKDRRTKAYKKHRIPSLHDDVWRLNKVDRKGCLAKNLKQEGIKTVGNFLVHLFRQPKHLMEIFDRSNHAKSWKITVKHARECPAKLEYCSSFDPKTKVVFNVSGQVSELSLDNQLLSVHILTKAQKEDAKKLVISAFENWGNVKVIPVDHDQIVAKPKTEQTFDNNIFLEGLDLHIDESSLFGNIHPETLPESLRTWFNEIYHGYESILTSDRLQLEADQKNRLCKSWKILFCIVTFKIRSLPENSLDDFRAYKKPRFSY
ncbi:hypothetical protein L2E82_27289 [Cichorium intybus]|uniref:Uncharacterized protein n=1 Tax=Cichorium intybus TaxID=13427 RepID=A0ACB9CT80_CICIN|nr:hypothetical protein L2E82_27289 [Cichorium intybus]